MSFQTSTFTEVYFHHIKGGSILKYGAIRINNPKGPVLNAKKASPFRIIPLNDQGQPMSSACWTISTRSQYFEKLRSEEWKNVAIQNDEGKYLSCRKKHPGGDALAEYRDEIGDFEKFEVEYRGSSATTFAFKSHNGLRLHYNSVLQIIAFKDRVKEKAGWLVNPFRLYDPSDDVIRSVHIVDREGNFLMQKDFVEGAKPAWHSEVMLKEILATLSEKMCPISEKCSGSCTIFEGEDRENFWFVTMTKEGIFNIAITAPECPSYIGAMCVEEIESIFDKCEESNREEKLQDFKTHISSQFQFATTGRLKKEIRKYEDRMQENIIKLQDNTEHPQDVVLRIEEMKELGQKCFATLSQLPGGSLVKGVKETPDILAKGAASLAGAFAGSALGNKFLGGKAKNVVDMTSNFELEGKGPIFKFWSKKFMSFGSKIGEVDIDLSSSLQGGLRVSVPSVPPSVPPSLPPPQVPCAPQVPVESSRLIEPTAPPLDLEPKSEELDDPWNEPSK